MNTQDNHIILIHHISQTPENTFTLNACFIQEPSSFPTQQKKDEILRTDNQRHFYESQCSWLSKFSNNNRNSLKILRTSLFSFPVAAIYTVLRVLSGKITRATTEQLVVSIEHQSKWNRDQHEVHFTKPIFRPQLCAWWQELF